MIKLQGNRILVKEIIGENKTSSGILLSAPTETFKKGTVTHIGEGHYQNGVLIPPTVKIGDTIIYPNASDVIIEGETYHLTNDETIIAII